MTVSGQAPVAYTYDAASRLRTITQEPLNPVTIDYDALGRRIQMGGTLARTGVPGPVATATYDTANRQLAFGERVAAYDANGNLVTQTGPDGTISYTWDARDRLIALAGPSVSASFGYDALDRRITRTVNGATSAFQYDGLDILRASGPGGETAYLRTLSLDETLAQFVGPEMQVPLTDALGSTLALLDAGGIPVSTYTYEPYGRVTTTGPPRSVSLLFTGREDDGTGLYYFRARYYDPALARFISEDPLGLVGGLNLYAYVGGSPLNLTDPLGLAAAGSKAYQLICDFVRQHYNDAAAAGRRGNIAAEFILGLSGHESKWGTSDAATDARGNFFGQSKPGGGLMTQGGFRNGAGIFTKKWGDQLRDPQLGPPGTIGEFTERLTRDPAHMYNALGKGGKGDPSWKEKVADAYNNVVEALKDPNCQPDCPPAGGR